MGYLNYDNSFSLIVARWPWLCSIGQFFRLWGSRQSAYISFARQHAIRHANATKRIPLEDKSVSVIYTSHMCEHLSRAEFDEFLAECRRLLATEGVLRVVVPDLRSFVDSYLENGDADRFIESLDIATVHDRVASRAGRLRFLVFGFREHKWMYDANSLVRKLKQAGFQRVMVLRPGETTILEPGNLDLREREENSVYVEATIR